MCLQLTKSTRCGDDDDDDDGGGGGHANVAVTVERYTSGRQSTQSRRSTTLSTPPTATIYTQLRYVTLRYVIHPSILQTIWPTSTRTSTYTQTGRRHVRSGASSKLGVQRIDSHSHWSQELRCFRSGDLEQFTS